MNKSNVPVSISELRERKSSLELRLEDGYHRISSAELEGRDVLSWETFWLSLLGEYEAVCNTLQEAA